MCLGAGRPSLGRVFQRVLIATDAVAASRDALVLGAHLTDRGGEILVAALLSAQPQTLSGGAVAAAARRAALRDGGEDVYATLGPDPRVRFMTLADESFAAAAAEAARRFEAQAVVVGQDVLGGGIGLQELMRPGATFALVIAPFGQRFVSAYAPRRVVVRTSPLLAGDESELARRVLSLIDQTAELDLLVLPSNLVRDGGAALCRIARAAVCPLAVAPSEWLITSRRIASSGAPEG